MRFPEVSLPRADFTELCDLLEASRDTFEDRTTEKKKKKSLVTLGSLYILLYLMPRVKPGHFCFFKINQPRGLQITV